MNHFKAQVDKRHYYARSYGFEGRFVSYYHQLSEVLKLSPNSVLEIGAGDKVFGSYIKNNSDILYNSVDFASDLNPDIVADIRQLPLDDKSYDVVCAFEVLEHLPFDDLETAIYELSRVAKQAVIISLPHFGPMLSFSLKIPFLPRIRWAIKLPFPKKHIFNGEHYWEMGKRGFGARRIKNILLRYGKIENEFIPFNSEYHHFFVLKIANNL